MPAKHKTGASISLGASLFCWDPTESIGRVDVACDVLAPDLAPDRGHFVASARSGVEEISDTILKVNGRSGRVETITVGKSPGRQVVLYDKRAVVIKTRKEYWVPI